MARPHFEYSNRVSRREANRALYVDFEGRKEEAPALVGVLFGRTFEVIVTDELLAPLVTISRDQARMDPGLTVWRTSLERALDHIQQRAESGGVRRVVAFSEHELLAIHEHVGAKPAEVLASRFLNARAYFASWWNTAHPGAAIAHKSLGACATTVGYEWPDEGLASPADALRRLRDQLETASSRKTPPSERTRKLWAQLIEYNRQDCLAMQFLVRHVAEARHRAEHDERQGRAAARLARQARNRRLARGR